MIYGVNYYIHSISINNNDKYSNINWSVPAILTSSQALDTHLKIRQFSPTSFKTL